MECPRCKNEVEKRLALSRRGKIDICNTCGTEEAMIDYYNEIDPDAITLDMQKREDNLKKILVEIENAKP